MKLREKDNHLTDSAGKRCGSPKLYILSQAREKSVMIHSPAQAEDVSSCSQLLLSLRAYPRPCIVMRGWSLWARIQRARFRARHPGYPKLVFRVVRLEGNSGEKTFDLSSVGGGVSRHSLDLPCLQPQTLACDHSTVIRPRRR